MLSTSPHESQREQCLLITFCSIFSIQRDTFVFVLSKHLLNKMISQGDLRLVQEQMSDRGPGQPQKVASRPPTHPPGLMLTRSVCSHFLPSRCLLGAPRCRQDLAVMSSFSKLLHSPEGLLAAGRPVRPVSAVNAIFNRLQTNAFDNNLYSYYFFFLSDHCFVSPPRASQGISFENILGLLSAVLIVLRQRQSETTSLPFRLFY